METQTQPPTPAQPQSDAERDALAKLVATELSVKLSSYVTFPILTAIVSVILIGIGWLFVSDNRIIDKQSETQRQYTEIQAQLSQIQTDLVWLKRQQ